MNNEKKIGSMNANGIKSVETSISIIETLKKQRRATVTEVAEETGYSPATVSKHLSTLRRHKFVYKRDGEFQLGLRYLEIGSYVRENIHGSKTIKKEISELAARTEEVVEYVIEDCGEGIVVYRELGSQGISGRTRVGSRLPMHQAAAGKAILAHLPDETVEEIVHNNGLASATENTITSKARLYEELDKVRERGYAINEEESTEGLYAIAVPIKIVQGEVIGACAVSGPTHRLKNDTKREKITKVLLEVANEVELTLSYE
jgi:DNA-binding IclR family transcriptional regulator